MKKYLLTVFVAILFISISWAQQLAFPTAEGYGKYTVGGRGGKVIEVTNLNASGSGSLGAAISASGARTVVFRVSGTITGNFSIDNDNITIAGQTAPGDGICIKGNLSTSADNIIIRYIRVRWDPSIGSNDAIGGRYQKNIIIDHVSASWSADETFTLYHNEYTTVQWCIISEACEKFENGVSVGHRFGGIWGNNYGTWHHNLFAHNASRNPRWASGCGYNDYRNNVLYNWGYASSYGGEAHQSGDRRTPPIEHSTINMVANYYKPGPATGSGVRSRIVDPSTRNGDADAGQWWVSDNVVEGSSSVTADNWKGVTKTSSAYKLNEPWLAMAINQQTAEDAYTDVLEYAGCSLPTRDNVDADIIDDVLNGTGKYGDNGLIDVPSDVGGWPTLNSTTAPNDSDHDGMPDEWEIANGLDPNNANDRNDIGEGGYTNLEVYLFKLVGKAEQVTGVSVSPEEGNVGINNTIQLNAIVIPYGSSNQNVSWSSSDTAIAKVSSTGLVTGVAEGSATITVTTADGGFTAQSTITVINIAVTGVEISLNSLSVNVGATGELTASVIPSNALNQNLSWSSSDTLVATVDSEGLVSGISEGTATITATSEEGGFTAECIVTVISATIYQAENNTSKSGNSVLSDFGGYTGSGYVDFGSNGDWIEWNNIDGGSGGNANLIFRYANGSSGNRQCAISVNGTDVGNLSFSSTGTWEVWMTQTISASLNTGDNTVRVTVNTSNGGPNLDYVNVLPLQTAINVLPDNFAWLQNYPNPFNAQTTINYTIKSNSEVKLSVYDITGKKLVTLVNQWQTAGEHIVLFDAGNLESGVYFLDLQTDLQDKRAKMILIK